MSCERLRTAQCLAWLAVPPHLRTLIAARRISCSTLQCPAENRSGHVYSMISILDTCMTVSAADAIACGAGYGLEGYPKFSLANTGCKHFSTFDTGRGYALRVYWSVQTDSSAV